MNLTKLAMMAAVASLPLVPAQAEEAGHGMHGASVAAVESASVKAFKAADAKMHKEMAAVGYTGDADVDFLRAMIPHHQGAVEMAKAVIAHGSDADVRMLANDIIKAQDKEIRWMKDWLAKHGPAGIPDAKASDTRVDVPVSASAVTAAAPQTEAVVKAVDMVSGTGAASGTIVTSTVPPTDKVSATTADAQGLPEEMDDFVANLPAPDEAIMNTAPKMEFLDGPVQTSAPAE